MPTITRIQPRALVRASGGPRYAVALAVDALGTGLLRPFLLLYGVTVLRLSASATGLAMTAGSHRVTVQAKDSSGVFTKQSVTITVK